MRALGLRGSDPTYFTLPQSLRDSSLYTREPLGCSRTSAFFGRFLNILGIATPVCATLRYDCHRQSLLFQIRCAEHHWFAMTTFYFGVHNDMRDTNRRLKMQNALRRKAGGRMGYEIQGFPTGMSVFSRMAWSRASRFSSWVKRKAFCLPSQQTTR